MKNRHYSFLFSIIGLLVFFPVAFLIVTSFALQWTWPQILPTEWSTIGWNALIEEPKLFLALRTSIGIGAIVVFINLAIGFPAAKVLAFQSFKGKSFIEAFLLMPILIPGLAVAMGLHLTMIRIGVADHWAGVALVHLVPTIPYTIKIFRSGFERVGSFYELQALSLGASQKEVFTSIYLPQLITSIRSATFLIFVISLSQYALTAIIGGGNVVTLAMIYFPYLSSVNNAVIASFSLLFAGIPLLFILIIEIVIRMFIPYRSLTNTQQ
ncbi:ABC transporter permease [Salipaludibacillus neizhouensis]|uniref:ABC transporter permease n=1 Tax=Salipaludibacillus neizhouensis TaxID=885475 RepID=A0A3A9KMW4_9BACI|nr:ABC transporter permease subunit [Salipaludibacillus neizhouensis]RKL69255.1 ABC transporter permease [Salipaludibacillus neizhouensis]